MIKLLLLLSLLITTNAWAEVKGLECKSEASSSGDIGLEEGSEIFWYRIDFDKGTTKYNASGQDYLTKLKDLIGVNLRGDSSKLYWREGKAIEVELDRQTLVLAKLNISFKCTLMNGSQVIRKRDAYFKEILEKNKI